MNGSESGSSNLNILLIEDYEPNIEVESYILTEMGHQCDIAKNGMQALEKFHSNRYDIILMDLQLPDIDGFETTKRMRTIEKEEKRYLTPIIGITACSTEDDRVLCLKAGMNDHLPKPFRMAELENKLRSNRREQLCA